MAFRGNAMSVNRVAASRRRTIGSSLVLALVGATLVVLALKHDGAPIQDVELNDGGVWVTNGDLQLMGRLNSQIKELDLGILTSSTSRELFQEASSVQALDNGGGSSGRRSRVRKR